MPTVCSAIEGDMSVYVCGSRGETCVVVARSDASDISLGGQWSGSSRRQRLTWNGRNC